MSINELRQKRAALIAQARSLVDAADRESRGMNQEEENQYNALMADVNRLGRDIERREQLEAMEERGSQAANEAIRPGPERGGQAVVEYRGQQFAERPGDYVQAYRSFLRQNWRELTPAEQRALSAGLDTAGGYLMAPLQMVQGILQAVDNLVYMRQWATVIPVTGSSDGLGIVSLDNDPADPTWTSELAIGSEDSTMSFGRRELHPHPLAKYIKVSRKLLRKVPSIEGLVQQRLGYKFAVTMENAYLNGSGAQQPLGVFTASALGISTSRDVSTGNTTTSMTLDGLKEAKYTLKGQYWPRARWMFHRDGVKQIAKIKDGDGNYIWEPAVRAGEPDRLLNFPVGMSEYAPNTFTNGLYVGILGDFSFYQIADDLNMEIQRLDELYAATNQVGYLARMENDGMPVLEEAFVRVKLAP